MGDGSGDISEDEFCRHLKDPEMVAFASSLEIEVVDVAQFFNIISGNGKYPVDVETFVVGCIKLKGLAKSIDLLGLIHLQKKATRIRDVLRHIVNSNSKNYVACSLCTRRPPS